MVPPKLLQYVESQLDAGISASAVRHASLSVGWKKADVDAAIAAAKPKTVKHEAPKEEPAKEEKQAPATVGPGHFQPFTELLTKPINAIVDAKTKNWIGSILILFVSLLLIGGAVAIKVASLANLPLIGGMFSFMGAMAGLLFLIVEIAVVAAGFATVIFLAFLKKVLIKILGGKGDFYRAFTAIAYGTYVPAIGLIIAAALGLTQLGIIADSIGAIIFVITLVIGIGTSIRAFTELFEVQLLVPIIASAVIFMAVWLAICGIMLAVLPGMISGLMGNLMGGLGSSLLTSMI